MHFYGIIDPFPVPTICDFTFFSEKKEMLTPVMAAVNFKSKIHYKRNFFVSLKLFRPYRTS